MARAEAFCIEMNRNATLQEVHEEFFRQPVDSKGERKRFSFLCGDPCCRALAKPRVSGVLYWHPDVFSETWKTEERHRPPHWRRIHGAQHIVGCTWDEPQADDELDDFVELDTESGVDDKVVNDPTLGMLWQPEPRVRNQVAQNQLVVNSDNETEDLPEEEDDHTVSTERPQRTRPDSTRFLADIAMRYLRATSDDARKNMPLSIAGRTSEESFYNVCLPVFLFNPHHQKERIYRGRAKVYDLNNVFLINFNRKFNPYGRTKDAQTEAKIKYLKRALDEDDRQLAEALKHTASTKEEIWCFFYTETPPVLDVKEGQERGWFTVARRDHLFMCPISRVGETDVKG